jgi:Fur family peroxide stress response transcriptional regulator
MSVPPEEVDRRLAEFVRSLRGNGARLTHQRLEVARELAGDDTHPDVEAVYRRVRERVPTISLDTVYRTVAALAGLGLIDRVDIAPGPARYDANLDRHHHYVFTRCGLTRDIYSAGLDGINVPEETSALGTVESVKVQLRGICCECLREEHDHGR